MTRRKLIVLIIIIVMILGTIYEKNKGYHEEISPATTTSQVNSTGVVKSENSKTAKRLEEKVDRNKDMKAKMDLLIPLAKDYKLDENAVRSIVEILENCGVDFNKVTAGLALKYEPKIKDEMQAMVYTGTLTFVPMDFFIVINMCNGNGKTDKVQSVTLDYDNHSALLYKRLDGGEKYYSKIEDLLPSLDVLTDVVNTTEKYIESKGGKIRKDGDKKMMSIIMSSRDDAVIYRIEADYDVPSKIYGQDTEQRKYRGYYKGGKLFDE